MLQHHVTPRFTPALFRTTPTPTVCYCSMYQPHTGISLGRTGKLCLLSVAPAPPPDAPPDSPGSVFLLDVTTLSSLAFTHKPGNPPAAGGSRGERSRGRGAAASADCSGPGTGGGSSGAPGGGLRCLKEMLECPSVTKLFFDVRCDAEALYHQHGVNLRGVVDLQLSEVRRSRRGQPGRPGWPGPPGRRGHRGGVCLRCAAPCCPLCLHSLACVAAPWDGELVGPLWVGDADALGPWGRPKGSNVVANPDQPTERRSRVRKEAGT